MSTEIKQMTADDISNTQQMCALLMKSPHYAKMGAEGIYAIIEAAKSLNVDPRQALGGGMYYVKGKVEMSARLMNALIRSKGHSVSKDKKSDDTICILHGKRADNGDTWTESFSIVEAQKAGLLGSMVWKTYPRDMLFARALSRLARQLFPDLIGNLYVEHELSIREPIVNEEATEEIIDEKISEEEVKTLTDLLIQVPEYKDTVENFFLEKRGINSFMEIDRVSYDKITKKAKALIKDKE